MGKELRIRSKFAIQLTKNGEIIGLSYDEMFEISRFADDSEFDSILSIIKNNEDLNKLKVFRRAMIRCLNKPGCIEAIDEALKSGVKMTIHLSERLLERVSGNITLSKIIDVVKNGKKYGDPKYPDTYIKFKDGVRVPLTRDGDYVKSVMEGLPSRTYPE